MFYSLILLLLVTEQLPENQWKRVAIRDSTKGKLFVDILHHQVWLWDGEDEKARRWHLIVRREANSPTKKRLLSWYHHMTMVMMAMLFMLEQRITNKMEISLLSGADIAAILKATLPRRDITESEMLEQLEKRHPKRQASIDSAYEAQGENGLCSAG